MLKIGDFSKLTQISIRMLRYYDEFGLLKPASVDEFTGYRYYSVNQLAVANKISSLKAMGFSLAEIAKIISQHENKAAVLEFLETRRIEALSQLEDAKRRITLIETAAERIRKDEKTMEYSVAIKDFPQMYAASVRKVIPTYNDEGMLWQILREETKDMNLQFDSSSLCMALFYDEGFKEENVDVEILMTVKGKYADTENVKFKTIAPCKAATVIFKGIYNEISEANNAIAAYINDNGYEFKGTMFNIYHVSPAQTNNPDEYVTEVCWPVKEVK